jgi:cell division protein FtsI (penicillin-binding protein 3)
MTWRVWPDRDNSHKNLEQGRAAPAIKIQGARKESIEIARNRMLVAAALFSMGFLALGLRLIDLGFLQQIQETRFAGRASDDGIVSGRADILDRNGVILATNLMIHSLYADPKKILDAPEAAIKLARLFPDLDRAELLAKLTTPARFVWIKRKLTPEQMYEVNRLGLPGLDFQSEEQRIYPMGNLAAHAVGYVDIDGRGLSGVERYFDQRLRDPGPAAKPLRLALDMRVQQALRSALQSSMADFQAIGAVGLVMNVHTGEVVSMVSLPDFDPAAPGAATPDQIFNRTVQGVYEMGSGLKVFTIAMGLESGTVTTSDGYDATNPIHIARFTIEDDHPKRRWLTIPEIFIYSSNIGSAKLALDVGTSYQRKFLGRAGLLQKSPIELREAAEPLVPNPWNEINTMTIAFGHGLAITPLQLVSGVAKIVNGGRLTPATMLAHNDEAGKAGQNSPGDKAEDRIVSEKTSMIMRRLLRLVVEQGTGEKADVPGYLVGGKTGTAEKSGVGGYRRKALLSSFMGVFPMDDPQYIVMAMLDEPKGTAKTFNFATGGWTAAPAVAQVIARIGPLLGVEPRDERLAENYQNSLYMPVGR